MTRWKIRGSLYFLGFVLIISKHWVTKYGFHAPYELIHISLCDPNQFLVAASRTHKIFIDFLGWCLIRPCVFTFLFLLFEKTILRIILRSNQYVARSVRYLPIFLICFGILCFDFDNDWIDWLIQILFCSYLIGLNWRLFFSQWKRAVFYCLGLLLVGFYFWTKKYIGDTNVDQLLSTFMFGFHGLFSVSPKFIQSMANYLLFVPLLVTTFILFFGSCLSKNKHLRHRIKLVGYIQIIIPTALLITGVTLVCRQYHFIDVTKSLYHVNQNPAEDDFSKNYKNPADVTFHITSKPKNLILIYVESLESTYQNPQLFGHNLLATLSDIKQPNISFHKFKQSGGAGWTLGGLVSSQCGIPLKLISIFNGNDIGENVDQFLSGAICLGDVLSRRGYKNIFLNGPSTTFSGVGTFFKSHHYVEIVGKEEWLAKKFSVLDMIGWGLPDDLLFQEAKLRLNQLMKKNRLFNLTILTIDTHGRDGQLNKTCYARGAKKFEDIIECTAYEVADFINYIERHGWMDRVTILVTGDHLAMENAVSKKLQSRPERYVFNMIINQDSLEKNRETILHVDLFPTILNALGITWSDEHLALGYSGIMPLNHKLSSIDHFNTIEKIVASRSNAYNKLWLPRNT